MDNKEIGSILRGAREKAGFSRDFVADLMGKSPAAIGHWETGHTGVDANTLFTLCRIYGIDMNEAFGFADKSPRSAPPTSPEAAALAAAYDRADEKSRKMARLALEDFMQPQIAAPKNVHDWTPDEMRAELERQIADEEADRKKGTTESSTGSPNVSGAECA